MNCFQCSTEWCYVCGKPLSQLDLALKDGDISMHNVDWFSNPARCPFMLNEIGQIDGRYNFEDGYACLDTFHNIIKAEKLQKWLKKYSKAKLQELCDTFESIQALGINVDDVLKTNTTLIIRIPPENTGE